MNYISFIVIAVFLTFTKVVAQQNDSLQLSTDSITLAKATKKENYSGPRHAAIMSAILPGLGQAYNKKYWKIPIIYAGIAGFGYLAIHNNSEYLFYRKNLIAVNDDDPTTNNTTLYSSDQLQTLKNDFKKNRDLSIFGVAIIYLLNIIDANVDAHLKTFEVSDDLSLKIDPWQSFYSINNSYQLTTGISIKLNFK